MYKVKFWDLGVYYSVKCFDNLKDATIFAKKYKGKLVL
jgi:hypothetical protein